VCVCVSLVSVADVTSARGMPLEVCIMMHKCNMMYAVLQKPIPALHTYKEGHKRH
jgi:hypothetical protein